MIFILKCINIMNKLFIKKILRESIKDILEARDTEHSIERFNERLTFLSRTNSLSSSEVTKLTDNLKLVQQHNFPKKSSYAIKLGNFKVKKESPYYKITKSGEPFYSVPNKKNPHITSDGNEFWVIVRGNDISTLMLRRKLQLKNTKVAKDSLNVDIIIYDINNYIEDAKRHKISKNKYKKIKLTNGEIIRFYPEMNKFENEYGQEVNLDDILDFLSEKDSQYIFQNI